MAFNEALNNRIREALQDVPNIDEKHLFGGTCYMVNNKMCIGVAGNDMMCRIGPDAYEAALEQPGCREMDFTGKPMKGYVFVAEEAIRSTGELQHWVTLCLAFNKQAKATKKKIKTSYPKP